MLRHNVIDVVLKYKRYLPIKWQNIKNNNDVLIKPLNGGLTNILYLAELKDNTLERVVVRYFGEGNKENPYFSRQNEIIILEKLTQLDWCSTIYAYFNEQGGGRFEEFLFGHTLLRADLLDEKLSQYIATNIRKLHQCNLNIPNKDIIFHKYVNKWLDNLCDYSNNEYIEFFKNEVQWLEKHLIELPIVFCHNDLQEGNLIYNDKTDILHIIDYEYAGYNYRAFDIGNHLNEYHIDYHHNEFPFFKIYKNNNIIEARNKFITFYNQNLTKEYWIGLKEVHIGMLSSHLLWSIWAFLQEMTSDINFGYKEYAIARIKMYKEQKMLLKSNF